MRLRLRQRATASLHVLLRNLERNLDDATLRFDERKKLLRQASRHAGTRKRPEGAPDAGRGLCAGVPDGVDARLLCAVDDVDDAEEEFFRGQRRCVGGHVRGRDLLLGGGGGGRVATRRGEGCRVREDQARVRGRDGELGLEGREELVCRRSAHWE